MYGCGTSRVQWMSGTGGTKIYGCGTVGFNGCVVQAVQNVRMSGTGSDVRGIAGGAPVQPNPNIIGTSVYTLTSSIEGGKGN